MTTLSSIIEESSNSTTPNIGDVDAMSLQGQRFILMGIEEVLRFNQDTRNRTRLAGWAAIVVTGWLFMVLVLLFVNQNTVCVLNHVLQIKVSDQVLISLLVTTTLNVLGLTFIVLKGYFPEKKEI
ncbi:hypothetical protein VB776_13295 [Arcicella sp. DC2W]|uniref:Uncharacterized protein n=1 Tax=Arcicella gelida TaxID=2984195 RepID=A0ABU5S617_9BACT|nr:hypothetical protein [Arcicella sp. DC2W]MEA5403897.1 hypothetical protein [Arcicella sp. DC2W]